MEHVTEPLSSASSRGEPPTAGAGADLTGQVFGDFQVLRSLGQGGMGQVYLAEQISLKRKVALKLLRPELAADAVALKRFKAEAEAVARATHANIVQVYAIGEAGGLHYMALEYVEGRNLREYVEKKGPPEVLVTLSIIRQVASALERASELGIIHRDIKPENILLTRKGEAKVTDFGLSRILAEDRATLHLTKSGVTMGTPLYMSPEQVEGKPVDPRTDIYSFGITCYYLLAGQPPYQGQNTFEVALQHVQGQARLLSEIRPDLPPALCAVIHKMMARQPEDRYQTAREIVRDAAQLRDAVVGVAPGQSSQLLATNPIPTPVAALTQPTGTIPSRPGRWLRWTFAGSLLIALVGGAWWGSQRSREPSAPKAPSETAESDPLFPSHAEREQFLAGELKLYANPGNDRQRIMSGLKCAIALGQLYLDDGKADKAEALFKHLDSRENVVAYQTLGKLGQAIVLARADRAASSNLLFDKVVPKRGPRQAPSEPQIWFAFIIRVNADFRREVARALNRNFDNNPAAFPQRFNYLRRPPNVNPRGRGQN